MISAAELTLICRRAAEDGLPFDQAAKAAGMALPKHRPLPFAPPLCFFHIPKSGGSSVQVTLESMFDVGEIAPARIAPHYDSEQLNISAYRYYGGHIQGRHFDSLPTSTQIFTIIRDPVELVVSLFHFSKRLSPERYDEMQNSQPWLNLPSQGFEKNRYIFGEIYKLSQTSSLLELLNHRLPRSALLGLILSSLGSSIGDDDILSAPDCTDAIELDVRQRQERSAFEHLHRIDMLGASSDIQSAIYRLAKSRGWPAPPALLRINDYGDPTQSLAQYPDVRDQVHKLLPGEFRVFEAANRKLHEQLAHMPAPTENELNETYKANHFMTDPVISVDLAPDKAWGGFGWGVREVYNQGLHYRRIEGAAASIVVHLQATGLDYELGLVVTDVASTEILESLSAQANCIELDGKQLRWQNDGTVLMTWRLPAGMVTAATGKLQLSISRPQALADQKLRIGRVSCNPVIPAQ